MRDLRTIRIFLSVLFLAASVATLFIGSGVTPMAAIAGRMQIIPSALSTTIGATGFWLVATFVFGRIYCSSVCPLGALQDSADWLRRRILRSRRAGGSLNPRRRRQITPYSWQPQAGRWRTLVLLAYVVCLLLGLLSIATILEPWNLLRSAARLTNREADAPWLMLAADAGLGALLALLAVVAIWVGALLKGRPFCTEVCPIGTTLGYLSTRTLYHIEIDPDRCTNCMRCEAVCKVQGISVKDRIVDNSRCVRCFDCLKVCADDAIRFQSTRNRRVTPLMDKT